MDTRYTDGTYLAENPGWHAQDAGWKLSHVRRALRRAGAEPYVRTVRDAGCGAGEVVKIWARRRPDMRFTGYEISPQAYVLCQNGRPPNCVFRLGRSEPEEPCDAVVVLDVLEHIPDWKAFFRKWTAGAAFIVVHMPLDLSVYARLRPSILKRERETVGHIHFFTGRRFLRELAELGVRPVHMHYTNKYLERPPELKNWKSRLGMFIRRAAHRLLPEAWAAYWVGGYSLMLVLRRED